MTLRRFQGNAGRQTYGASEIQQNSLTVLPAIYGPAKRKRSEGVSGDGEVAVAVIMVVVMMVVVLLIIMVVVVEVVVMIAVGVMVVVVVVVVVITAIEQAPLFCSHFGAHLVEQASSRSLRQASASQLAGSTPRCAAWLASVRHPSAEACLLCLLRQL